MLQCVTNVLQFVSIHKHPKTVFALTILMNELDVSMRCSELQCAVLCCSVL